MTNKQTGPSGLVEVTQADREEAVRLAELWHSRSAPMHGHGMDTLAGRCDDTPLVQAFAKHRLASLPPVPVDEVERAANRINLWLITQKRLVLDESDCRDLARAALTASRPFNP